MSEVRPGGFLIIIGTFLVGLTLSQLPLPVQFEWVRPEWVPMILIYWVLALPHRVSIGTAWMLGLTLDLLKGSALGLNALALTLIAFLTLLIHQRLRMFPLWKQALMVLVLVGINQLTFHWMQSIAGNVRDSLMFMLPSLVSALLWPCVFVLLRSIRRTFRVT
ncbi:rod shape-determining protein MreD [Marinobacterium rhizophilum]|uniref:rod shape-determining protein MreD n=1 Tax=Marinobacterium rhizophilum TaxID=420402 RepID=UPI00036B5762|nr:rod shape-determining protein MreD [Marinobacterium rhizophilum]